jgi:8-oxo-dGTP pyrophosphatase MutT (NUDIX family)
MSPADFTILAAGDWTPANVRTSWTACSRAVVAEVEQVIEQTWSAALRPGVHLFDGPMCRLESWHAAPDKLELTLSLTSYKPFLGTNLTNSGLADRFGPAVLANPVGVSAGVITADGFLALGQRNASVAYYPNRVHPFAGALEPTDAGDVFAAVRRELQEEIGASAEEIIEMRCAALAQDNALRQPELIFPTRVSLSRQQIEARLDAREHHGCMMIPLDPADMEHAMQDPELTPIARATVLVVGRARFGDSRLGSLR